MDKAILYDNPSRFGTGTCWSPNVWRTRLLLNFKGINYKTKWLHGPDIAPTLKSLGIPPHKAGTEMAEYTIPSIQLPNGSYIMESTVIAEAIEAIFPEPSAHLDASVLDEVMATVNASVVRPLVPLLVPRMPRECLSGTSIAYQMEAGRKLFGMSLVDLEARHGGNAWEKALPGLHKLVEILKQDPTGPFCLGTTPSYADFIIVGFMEWCNCLGGDHFQNLLRLDPVFGSLYAGCAVWLQKNH